MITKQAGNHRNGHQLRGLRIQTCLALCIVFFACQPLFSESGVDIYTISL